MTNRYTIESVEPNREYTSQEIQELKLIPWALSSRKLTYILKKDFFGENILKARIEGEGRRTRYFVKGSNIIKFKEKYGSTPWIQPKRHVNTKGNNRG